MQAKVWDLSFSQGEGHIMADRICHGRGMLGLVQGEKEEGWLGPPWSEEKIARSDRTLVERDRLGPLWSEEKGIMSDRTSPWERCLGPFLFQGDGMKKMARTTLVRGENYKVRSDLD